MACLIPLQLHLCSVGCRYPVGKLVYFYNSVSSEETSAAEIIYFLDS